MVVYPNAKINLGLNVVSKREDGFHDLETVFYPIPLRDILEIKENNLNKVQFSSSGINIPNSLEGNLVVQAYDLLKKDFDLPFVNIHLHKIIPIGAGLGGGSSDSSFALKALNDKFDLKLTEDQLENYASKLGSDCPFFIKNNPVFASGKGDEFQEVSFSLKGKFLHLIYPAIHVSTATAYGGIVPKASNVDMKEIIVGSTEEWKGQLNNDFEKSVFRKHPTLSDWKNKMYKNGAFYACMSGSGSSIVGLFNEKPTLSQNGEIQQWILEL